MEKYDVIIIGAGPAGMMAAIQAAKRKKNVLLLERNDSLGKKLLVSGKGRCNITNASDIKDFLDRFSSSRKFLRNSFAKFFNAELLSFFEDAHLKFKTERDGRVFPKSDRAADILDALKSRLKSRYITVFTGQRVRKIVIKDKKIQGVLTHSGKNFLADNVVIATGGMSYPETGSTGDGYRLAEEPGHKIVALRPALFPIIIKEKFIRKWQGIPHKHVRLSVNSSNKKIGSSVGEMIFTHFGISGPVVFDISGCIYDALGQGKEVTISINFKPDLDENALNAKILYEFKANHKKSIKNVFKNLLPKGMSREFLDYCDIDEDKSISHITTEERKRFMQGLSGLRLTCLGAKSVKNSVITRGGVETREINPKTMESRLVKGLYFAGEVIDVDAKTGGYNMQAAFSTGWVCGDSV